MHYWNVNAVFNIREVGINWVPLRCLEIVSSTDERHFLVINLASEVLQDKDIS